MKKTASIGSLPFMGTMSDGFELMKKLWGATGLPTPAGMAQFAQTLPQTLPNMIAPTIDVEELDRRIADLRAVEQWLNLNVSMLRTTIQTLEVQRNTIATLRSFGGAMMSTISKAEPHTEPMAMTMPTPEPAPAPPTARRTRTRKKAAPALAASMAGTPFNPATWWNTLQEQFTKVASTAVTESEPRKPAKKSRKARRNKVEPD